MAEGNFPILALNRGRVSSKALARIDLERMAFSAETQTNYMPRVLGSMSLRPGWQYLIATQGNAAAKYLPFVFATDDTALVEVTASGIRFVVDDAVITRASVSTSITNGTFDSDLTGWTDADETGATSSQSDGNMSLVGTEFDAAKRQQEVTVASGDRGTEHGITFTVTRGPLSIRIGSTTGGDDYIRETELGTGTYSFAFTPTGNFHIEIAGRQQAASLLDSVAIDSSGALSLPSPWGASDLGNLRWDQSGDVIFVACQGYQQRKIERFVDTTSKSWGVSLYQPEDGPFRAINTSTITLTPSAQSGDITLTASRGLFRGGHVGALFAIDSVGQNVTASLTGENQFTDSIRVIGVDNTRIFQITLASLTGTSTTVTLQRSIDEEGSWTDVSTFTSDVTNQNHDDGLDNQIAFYRIGVKTGDYSSGTIAATLSYSGGSIKGVVRITARTSDTVVSAAVLKRLGGTDASRDWNEGSWSDFRGYPTSVALYEGRLWWAGKANYFGSISDAFAGFDPDFEGDAGPINRTFGSGPIDVINSLLPLQRLIAMGQGEEISIRSGALDEVITPDNVNAKGASTQGSAAIPALKIDHNGVFVQRGAVRVYETSFPLDAQDYRPTDLTDIIPEIGEPAIVRAAVQRQIDTRLHFVRSDGTVALLLRELDNDVLCWIDIETDGLIEDVVVLPSGQEDAVYYVVNRTINGATKRYLEKWALESDCIGSTLNKQADSFATFTNSPAAASVPAGTASHLAGETVVVWADGKCMEDSDGNIATFTVSSDGGITALTDGGAAYSATTGVVGLAYQARFKSVKMAYAARFGTALTQRKRISHVGLVMENTHYKGIKFGPDFTTMDELPLVDNEGAEVSADTVHASYDEDMTDFPSGWDPDSRLCLESNAPRPATILGLAVGIDETDKL